MTQVFWSLPQINAKAPVPPAQKRNIRGVDGRRKGSNVLYDHDAMLKDRIAGMSWASIERKYKVKPKKWPGNAAKILCMNSNAIKRMTSQQIAQLNMKEHLL